MRQQHDNEKTAAHKCLRNGLLFWGSPGAQVGGESYTR